METKEKALHFFYYAAFAGLCIALLPWLSTFWTQAVNTDIAFLTLSAERMLDGLSMSEAYYDTNLPLSIIVQIPAAALAKFTPLPLYYAANIYALTLLVLSFAAVAALLARDKDLSLEQRFSILGIYLLTNTLLPNYDFGQKDHFLAMALIPLVLTQILITRKTQIPPLLKHIVLAAGAFFILIKPHYGLLPAAIFIHRAITQRRLSVVRDADFLWLAGMAIGYIAVLLIFFNDFLTIILPDIIKYYASDISTKVVLTGIILMIKAIVPFFLTLLIFKKAPGIIPAFSLFAVLSFIPFIIQGKGWVYHALPANIFFYICAFALFSYAITAALGALSKIKTPSLFAHMMSFALPMLILFTLVIKSYAEPPSFHRITHQEYKNTAFAKRINTCKEEYGKECTFLIFNDTINIAPELQTYTDVPNATRFPLPWFVPALLNEERALEHEQTPQKQEQFDTAVSKYMNMIARDFARYDPEIVFVGHFSYYADPEDTFNMRSYTLEKAPDLFIPVWERYELEDSVIVDRLDYMIAKFPDEDRIRYDIYRKKHSTEQKNPKELNQP